MSHEQVKERRRLKIQYLIIRILVRSHHHKSCQLCNEGCLMGLGSQVMYGNLCCDQESRPYSHAHDNGLCHLWCPPVCMPSYGHPCSPEQAASQHFPEDNTCKQNRGNRDRDSVCGERAFYKSEVIGCKSKSGRKESELLQCIKKVGSRCNGEPDSPEEDQAGLKSSVS